MKRRKHQRKYRTVFTPTPARVGWIIVVILFLVGAHKGTGYLMKKTGLFKLESVKITGNKYLSRSRIRSLIEVKKGIPLASVDYRAIEKRMLENRYLKAVSVNISLPSSLLIDVRERTPALYLVDKSIYMVDKDGLMLKKLDRMPLENIPLVTGLSVTSLLKNRKPLLQALELLRKIRKVDNSLVAMISEFHLKKDAWPEIYLVNGGACVLLGADKQYERIYRLSQFFKNTDILNRLPEIREIDLTFKNRVIIEKKS